MCDEGSLQSFAPSSMADSVRLPPLVNHVADDPSEPHNPKVGGSNPPPATPPATL